MSTRADIAISDGFFRGEDKALVFTILQASGVGVQNITGWTMTFRMASTEFGASVITKTPTLTDPTNGVCTVTLASADTSGLTNEGTDTTYYYDLRRTDSGSRAELAYGTIIIRDTETNG